MKVTGNQYARRHTARAERPTRVDSHRFIATAKGMSLCHGLAVGGYSRSYCIHAPMHST
jgi:hypothetical protein